MSTPHRIIVTGASGFLGARIAEILVEAGHSVALLLRSPDKAWRIKDIMPRADVIQCDFLLKASYAAHIEKFQPDTLVHAAWLGVSGAERNDVLQTYNIASSTDLLKAAIESGAKNFIGIGSQAEYGPQNKKLNEDALLQPTTLYGHSKVATYNITKTMCECTGVRFAWARLFSAYGPRDNPDWIIPSLIRKIKSGEKPALTACEQLWDFVHIDDAAAAIVSLVETTTASGAFNLGGGVAPPLRQTVSLIRDIVNPDVPLGFGDVPYRPDQVMHLEADITRLQAQTGWSPKIELETGLKQTATWFS